VEWSSADRAVLVALVQEEWDTCPGCAQPLSETTTKEALGRYTLAEHLCAGCQVRAAADKDPDYPGRIVQVIRKPS
jgi:hypothetical protein